MAIPGRYPTSSALSPFLRPVLTRCFWKTTLALSLDTEHIFTLSLLGESPKRPKLGETLRVFSTFLIAIINKTYASRPRALGETRKDFRRFRLLFLFSEQGNLSFRTIRSLSFLANQTTKQTTQVAIFAVQKIPYLQPISPL